MRYTTFTHLSICSLLILTLPAAAKAAIIQLGMPHFSDGQLIPDSATYNAAVSLNPAPFNFFNGTDPDGPDFDVTFVFDYAGTDVYDASLTLGIYDHDAKAPGNQVALLALDGID